MVSMTNENKRTKMDDKPRSEGISKKKNAKAANTIITTKDSVG